MATNLLAGAIIFGNIVATLFFLRFWHRTRDRLFLMFAAAFFLIALHRGLVAALAVAREENSWLYLIRLIAFLLIIAAIMLKNAETSKQAGG